MTADTTTRWHTTRKVGETLELPGVTLRVAKIERGRVKFEVIRGAAQICRKAPKTVD